MNILKIFKNKFFKNKTTFKTSFPEFNIDVPMPELSKNSLQDIVKEKTKSFSTFQLVNEINRRKNENHDGYTINYVIGKTTGDIHIGGQSHGNENSICHACGLGYRCLDKDCPNTKIMEGNIFMYQPKE